MMKDKIIFNIGGPMKSGVHEASIRKYKLFMGKSGKRWVVADQPNAADNIYVDGGVGSQGFAGRTMSFTLVDNTVVDFIGPWKTMAEGLYEDTGYDVRNTYTIQGIISLDRKIGSFGNEEYSNILHYDESPQLGSFERIGLLAQKLANEHGKNVWYAYRSEGGGMSSWCKPEVKI